MVRSITVCRRGRPAWLATTALAFACLLPVQQVARANEVPGQSPPSDNLEKPPVPQIPVQLPRSELPSAPQIETALAQGADSLPSGPPDPVDQDERLIPPDAIEISLPILVDGRQRAPAIAAIDGERLVGLSPTGLAASLQGLAAQAVIEGLVALGPAPVALAELRSFGIEFAFDPMTLAIAVDLPLELRDPTRVQLSGLDTLPPGELIQPENFAAGITTSLVAAGPIDGFDPRVALDFAGFANIGGYDGIFIDYGGSFQLNRRGQNSFFRRDRVTVFKDWQEKGLRLSAGDLQPTGSTLSGSPQILGVGLERDYQNLFPNRNLRPTFARRFNLERPSTVEVFVNDVLIERFAAPAGPLDLSEIALADASNNVVIVVEDSLGRREIDAFQIGSDVDLLAPGLDRFSVAIGVLSEASGLGVDYSDDPVITATYAAGLSNVFTIEANLAVTDDVQLGGAGFASALPFGVVSAQASLSHNNAGQIGIAGSASFRGSPLLGVERGEYATLTVDYRSADFSTIDSFDLTNFEQFSARADYQVTLGERTSVFANSAYLRSGPSETVTASVGLRRAFGALQISGGARFSDSDLRGTDYGVFASLNVRLGARSNVFAAYDSTTDRGRVEYRRQPGLDLPQLGYRAGIERNGSVHEGFASLSLDTSRFSADAGLSQVIAGNTGGPGNFMSARLTTGFAFADGNLALARDPARGFALVSRHESLEGAILSARTGGAGRVLARADDLGPAVADLQGPYRPTTLGITVEGAPPGYDTGPGNYVLVPGARSGYHIEIGGEQGVTAMATLVLESEPVGLASGIIRSLSDGRETPFFTNRQGRALFEGLRPGWYEIILPVQRLHKEIEIYETEGYLLQLGEIGVERQ